MILLLMNYSHGKNAVTRYHSFLRKILKLLIYFIPKCILLSPRIHQLTFLQIFSKIIPYFIVFKAMYNLDIHILLKVIIWYFSNVIVKRSIPEEILIFLPKLMSSMLMSFGRILSVLHIKYGFLKSV